MYQIGVVSLFPEIVEPVLRVGVVGRAHEAGRVSVVHRSPRNFASDTHRTVDDRPYGGGPGMVMRYEPVCEAVRSLDGEMPPGRRILVMSAQGRLFDQSLAQELSEAPGMLLIAARYEGYDERISSALGAEEVSVGDYVMSGGELAAAVIIDAVVRLLPGTLGHEESSAQDSFTDGLLEYPQFTRPESIDGLVVPEVLLGGNHEAVRRWRLKQALGRTWIRRPDLLCQRTLTREETELLAEFRAEMDAEPEGDGISGVS